MHPIYPLLEQLQYYLLVNDRYFENTVVEFIVKDVIKELSSDHTQLWIIDIAIDNISKLDKNHKNDEIIYRLTLIKNNS